jgi:hypothetical protein
MPGPRYVEGRFHSRWGRGLAWPSKSRRERVNWSKKRVNWSILDVERVNWSESVPGQLAGSTERGQLADTDPESNRRVTTPEPTGSIYSGQLAGLTVAARSVQVGRGQLAPPTRNLKGSTGRERRGVPSQCGSTGPDRDVEVN